MEKVFFERMCAALQMGSLTEEPQQLSGGLLHKMYSVFTEKGKYAVKLLNPFVMQREAAMANFRAAESLENILEKNELPILPALSFDGKKMQSMDGQYFYVFEWFRGRALKPEEIGEKHVRKIGRTLAQIHKLQKCETCTPPDILQTDWASYTEQLLKAEAPLGHLLEENLSFLAERQNAANAALRKRMPVLSICHNDMDPKNVLWYGDELCIIDLECLSYADAQVELAETALCWSGLDACKINVSLFTAFAAAYRDAGGAVPEDWNILFDLNCGRLHWLEYCVQRAIGINCSEEEQILGKQGIPQTLSQLHCVENVREEILSMLSEI